MLVFIEDEFRIVLCHFQGENALEIPVTLQGKIIFDIQTTISLKNRRFVEKGATESMFTGTHTEAHSW